MAGNAMTIQIDSPHEFVKSYSAHLKRSGKMQLPKWTIGTQHLLDPLTIVKARVNNFGKASALIQHEWRPKSLITLSTEVDSKSIDKSAKFGLALALKP